MALSNPFLWQTMNIKSVIEVVEANQRRAKMILGKYGLFFESRRGNKTYASRQKKVIARCERNFLQGIVNNSVLFITLVCPYGNSKDECRESWKTNNKALGPFTKSLRKMGREKYIAVLEATKKGNCHVHLLLSWNRSLKAKIRNDKYYLAENDLLKSIRYTWTKEWGKVSSLALNNNAISIRVCPDGAIARLLFKYITKTVGKWSDITNVIPRVKENKPKELDLKKLFANYWGFTLNIRLLRTSRNLGKGGISYVLLRD